MFNAALWKKSLNDVRWLLGSCMVFMFAVHWLRVWISSHFTTSSLEKIFSLMPELVEPLLPVPFSQVASAAGRIAPEYDDPVVLLLVTVWAISRGSDAISGELNRGTMEMLLAQPVTRLGVLGTQAVVTIAGAAILAAVALGGTGFGLATIQLHDPVTTDVFVPAAANLFALTAFLAGLTTMVSAATNYRSNTIGIVGGFYAVSMVIKIVSRVVPSWDWLAYLTFFTPFEPQLLVSRPDSGWALWIANGQGGWAMTGVGYDSILIGLGAVCYFAAAVIFCRRDLPAPL